MEYLAIEIGSSGIVEAMHTDKFNLGFLGERKVRRQTEIKFNLETQKWDIIYLDASDAEHRNAMLDGFTGYEEARGCEVDWINASRVASIDPMSGAGLSIMGGIRSAKAA